MSSPLSQTALVRIDRETCHKLDLVLTREWLETDGRGGYASSTPLFVAGRRYHGLYVVPPPGLTKRHVFLSRFDETLHVGGRSFAISMARYPSRWVPHGHQYVESFELCPYPRTTFQIGGARIVREVLMARGTSAVLSRYSVEGDVPALELRLRPLVPFRDADSLTHENIALDPRVTRLVSGISVRPYPSLPALAITHSHAVPAFEADPVWYRQVEFMLDLERGYDGHEDQFSPGFFHLPLAEDAPLILAATIGEPIHDVTELWENESSHRVAVLFSASTDVRGRLELTADDFLCRTQNGRLGVQAGYPWFGEWGRDTFLSLPGLLLARDRVEECGEALSSTLPYLRRGLMPNIFGQKQGDSQYGSADAALWFVRAVRLYQLAGGSRQRLHDELAPALASIAHAYLSGTDLGIHVDEKGTLFAGDANTNATWMDARTSSGPVTPRHGAPVELNALWYFLLAYLEVLSRDTGKHAEARDWETRRRLCTRSFLRRFWLEDERRLADGWTPEYVDRSLRANMVLAAALEFSPLSRGKRTDIVQHANIELLTPRGLRTLAPFEKAYIGVYQGNQESRDAAYHQGTVWPWLLGSYCEAYLRAYGTSAYRVEILRELLDAFEEHLDSQGLGHVSEVFDGDPPHRPGGAIAQAWSTAELLRAYKLLEDVQP
ncbi:MAG TPA: amylo-alpha-1,6-glucosidase [Planctomycetota bacterium]|nr:amylo-alpha-1,6-glucosidase [Planctomycetota bacterium]